MVFPTASAGSSAQRVFRSLITFPAALTLQVFFPSGKEGSGFSQLPSMPWRALAVGKMQSSLSQTLNSISAPTSALLFVAQMGFDGVPQWLLSPCPGMETFMEVSIGICRKFPDIAEV